MQDNRLLQEVRKLPLAQRAKLAALLRKAISVELVERMLPAWTITIHLMGDDLSPNDDVVSIQRKLNRAANRLTTMTGATGLRWIVTPRPTFSFLLPKPELFIPRMESTESTRLGIQIRLSGEAYALKITSIAGQGQQSEVLKSIQGIDAENLKRTFERETKVYLSFR